MKKITFIIGTLVGGGAERVISVLANELSHLGYKVSIIVFRETTNKSYDIDEAVKRVYISSETDNRVERLLKMPFKLAKLMIEEAADVYISFCILENVVSLFVNLFLRKKLIISERNAPKHEQMPLIFKVMRKLLYPTATTVVFQTETAKECYSKIIQDKSVVIENPVKDYLPEKKDYSSKYTICAVGRLVEQKNYAVMLRAFSIFLRDKPNYVLNIYGSGKLESEIKKLVINLKIEDSVVLKGFDVNLHAAMVDSDFYIMSSDYEGMPNSLMEAMAMGLPVISTDCPSGGPARLIENDSMGFLIPVQQVEMLVEKMRILSENEELRRSMGENAKKVRSQYSKENIVFKWRQFLDLI